MYVSCLENGRDLPRTQTQARANFRDSAHKNAETLFIESARDTRFNREDKYVSSNSFQTGLALH